MVGVFPREFTCPLLCFLKNVGYFFFTSSGVTGVFFVFRDMIVELGGLGGKDTTICRKLLVMTKPLTALPVSS